METLSAEELSSQDFHVLEKSEITDENREASEVSSSQKRNIFSSFFASAKCHIQVSFYNLYHSQPTSLPEFSHSNIYLFGRCYQHVSNCVSGSIDAAQPAARADGDLEDSPVSDGVLSDREPESDVLREFLVDFRSVMFFCYRKDFAPLEPSLLTSDVGWGCMLRTGQMMLAKALVHHMLGRGWRLSDGDRLQPFSTYRKIMRWFSDVPQRSAYYSIHNMVRVSNERLGASADEAAGGGGGEWFSPTRVCQILKHLTQRHSVDQLTMYVAMDAAIYKDAVAALCAIDPVSVTPVESPSTSGVFDTAAAANGWPNLASLPSSWRPDLQLAAPAAPSSAAVAPVSRASSHPDALCPTPQEPAGRGVGDASGRCSPPTSAGADGRGSLRTSAGALASAAGSAGAATALSSEHAPSRSPERSRSDGVAVASAASVSAVGESLLESSAFEVVRGSTLGPGPATVTARRSKADCRTSTPSRDSPAASARCRKPIRPTCRRLRRRPTRRCRPRSLRRAPTNLAQAFPSWCRRQPELRMWSPNVSTAGRLWTPKCSRLPRRGAHGARC
eukprot:TRINITY_DN3400_c0_g1_i1.p1 TRINITY_DN3400_c0_g1~~TRINITY_DN3400_c0_g1_i1.p1  ORF type:complete len:560 (-),score=118.23 TRINITY_DN3400_c0_g1_i1:588-2267(-)